MNDLHTFIINLDKRTDRWEKIQEELKSQGIENFERFSAISIDINYADENFPEFIPGKWSRVGALGCLLSHYYVIKKAKEQKLDKILILEDDTVFINSISLVNDALEDLKNINWHLLYLSGHHRDPCEKFGEHTVKVKTTLCAQAYIVHSRSYDFILKNVLTFPREIDVFYTFLQKEFPCFCINPHLTIQAKGYSDIQNKMVDYTQEREQWNIKL
tara:strand:+ start:337 stop:981 length:645 start_codon:yes stop_codon:yes gene_type:complete